MALTPSILETHTTQNTFLNRGLFEASSKTSRHQFATEFFLNDLKSAKRLRLGGLRKKWVQIISLFSIAPQNLN